MSATKEEQDTRTEDEKNATGTEKHTAMEFNATGTEKHTDMARAHDMARPEAVRPI